MFFGGGLLRKKSLGEIFFKNGLWPEIYSIQLYWKSKSLNKIFDQYAQQYVALRRDLMGIALRLDILTKILKIIFNQNLFRVFRVFRGLLSSDLRRNLYGYFLGGSLRLEILEEIFFKKWPEARNYYE